MPDLDLKRLAFLEHEMPYIDGHKWILQGSVDYIGDSLGPLLDLVDRLRKALEAKPCTNEAEGCAKGLYSEVPGRWCARCRGLEYYREAKGE